MAETGISAAITQVGTVMVPVSDQDRAIEFFTSKLGFDKRLDTPYGDGDRWVEVAPPGGTTSIALVPPRDGESAGIETRIGFTTENIDSSHAELRDQGVDVGEVMRMGTPVPPMFFFHDEDGNNFLVVEQA